MNDEALQKATAEARRLEDEGVELRRLKRQAKFMSPEWKSLNRKVATNARACDQAWKKEATLHFAKNSC